MNYGDARLIERCSRSHLHNCYNGIGSWFYQAIGGIIPESPGYRRVIIDPQVPEGLEWAHVTKETPYGTIIVHWEKKAGDLDLRVDIPVGITATVCGKELLSGKYNLRIHK